MVADADEREAAMPLTRLEKLLPWTGAIAGACWIGHSALQSVTETDKPGSATSQVIRDHLLLNYASVGCLVLMGIVLLFFATAVRNLLRSTEPAEATWSSIAHGGWVVTAAGLSQMVTWNWGLIIGAAAASDDDALKSLSYVHFFGWAGMGIGLATAFIATGLGGLAGAVLPRWFAIATVACGVLGALGNAGIPPGGLVNYVLLPFWLIGASVIMARRQRLTTRSPKHPA
jgi:hypothetical protein